MGGQSVKRLFEFLKEGESLHETNAAYSETLEPFEKFYHLYGYVCFIDSFAVVSVNFYCHYIDLLN